MLEADKIPTDPKVMGEQAEELLASDNGSIAADVVLILSQLNPVELDTVGKRKYTDSQTKLILAAADLLEEWRN